MARPVWISPRARRDIVEIAQFIGRSNLEAAKRFLTSTEQLFRQLALTPHVGTLFESDHPRLDGVRLISIPRFARYVALFTSRNSEVHILRVLHGSRDVESAIEER